MKYGKLSERIRLLSAYTGERTPQCLDDHQIAAAVDGNLNWSDRDSFERHVADCTFCVTRLGTLNRLSTEPAREPVADITLAHARRLLQRARIKRYAPRWAAAAVVVLAVTLAFDRYSSNDSGAESSASSLSPVATQGVNFRQSRNIDADALRPNILAPLDGVSIDVSTARFRWTEIPGSLYYDIRIVTGDGDMVWQDRVTDTEWGLPGHLDLEPGAEYYVRVDAYLAETKSVNSRHVLFKIME